MKKLFLFVIPFLFASCNCFKQLPPEVHTVVDTVIEDHYVTDTLVENHTIHDTTVISHVEKDSVYHEVFTNQYQKGDTLIIEKTINHFEFKFVHDTLHHIVYQKDSIISLHNQIDSLQHLLSQQDSVPYPVEVEVVKNHYPLLPWEICIAVLLLAYFGFKLYRKFHKVI